MFIFCIDVYLQGSKHVHVHGSIEGPESLKKLSSWFLINVIEKGTFRFRKALRYNVKPFFIVNLCYKNKFKKMLSSSLALVIPKYFGLVLEYLTDCFYQM